MMSDTLVEPILRITLTSLPVQRILTVVAILDRLFTFRRTIELRRSQYAENFEQARLVSMLTFVQF